MADFEGDLNLNVETSEIEIKGKFKLTEEELDNVAGGNQNDGVVPHVVEKNYDYNYDVDKCPVCGGQMLPIAVGVIQCQNDPNFTLAAKFHVNHGGRQIEKWIVSSNDLS